MQYDQKFGPIPTEKQAGNAGHATVSLGGNSSQGCKLLRYH